MEADRDRRVLAPAQNPSLDLFQTTERHAQPRRLQRQGATRSPRLVGERHWHPSQKDETARGGRSVAPSYETSMRVEPLLECCEPVILAKALGQSPIVAGI